MPASHLEADRKSALEVYESAELPEWRRSGFWTTSLKAVDFDALQTRHYESVTSREELPQVVQDAIKGEEYAGLIVQRGASVIYTETAADNPEGVIATTLEDAFANHEALVRKFYGTKVGPADGKFAAGNAALWTGGAFFYVPKNTQVDKPFQVINVIDEPGTIQYGRLLAIVDVSGNARIREYNLAPDFDGQALHAGVSEIFAQDNAWAKVKTFQDWGAGQVFDISTKRVNIARDAHARWFPIHLGGHLTKQTLDIITAEPGADMRHNGVYFTQGDEHLDLFTTDRHESRDTTGDTVWKGASTGSSRASYEGLIEIIEKATNSHTYLQTHSLMLSKDAKVDAIPSLIVKVDDVSASHGGTVGEVDENLVFYMRTRGISREDAIRILVEGFFEPVVTLFEDEHLEALVRERIAGKLAEAREDIIAYAASK
ncbi:MAG: SufD family Fe-S cluster assembly protein [Thermoleophilaceae bacterium]|nr:SufD family Fe-S cluster assembly protein [Thermoleophilaceae bacterium]